MDATNELKSATCDERQVRGVVQEAQRENGEARLRPQWEQEPIHPEILKQTILWYCPLEIMVQQTRYGYYYRLACIKPQFHILDGHAYQTTDLETAQKKAIQRALTWLDSIAPAAAELRALLEEV